MALAGRDPDRPEGSDDPADGIEVTRLDQPAEAPLLTVEPAEATPAEALAIPLDDMAQAVQAAIAATEAGHPAADPAAVENEVQPVAAAPDPIPEQDLWYVTGSRVNLRAGPSTATSVIGQVTQGQPARVLEETDGGWVRIETADDGTIGYIFGRFLSQARPL